MPYDPESFHDIRYGALAERSPGKDYPDIRCCSPAGVLRASDNVLLDLNSEYPAHLGARVARPVPGIGLVVHEMFQTVSRGPYRFPDFVPAQVQAVFPVNDGRPQPVDLRKARFLFRFCRHLVSPFLPLLQRNRTEWECPACPLPRAGTRPHPGSIPRSAPS